MRERHQMRDSSDSSKTSAGGVNLAVAEVNHQTWPIDSSTILSDSVATGNSISELELPQQQHHMPDFSIFTANSMLPPPDSKGENSNGPPNNLKKGANPSPSGSFRRGRRREVKLEMTETSFYQEDEDNIEMGGNQTIHREENCQESGEIRQNLKELGPLVNEIFERARANSGSGRSSTNGRNSYQRDPMGSSRLGSASSRGSRGSQTHPKEQFKYANTKVTLPDRPTNDPTPRGRNRRPFSGDYVLVGRRNDVRADSEVRKSRSQPSSATSHKRQIGHNGRLGFEDGLSWSRFLQNKGYDAGQIFTKPQYYHKGQRSRLLPIMDKSHFMNQDQVLDGNVNVLNVESEHKQFGQYDNPGVNVLDVEAEHMRGQVNATSSAEPALNDVNILNIEEQQRRQIKQTGEGFQYNPNINLSHVNVSDEEKQILKQKHKSLQKAQSRNRTRNVNVLNLDEERRKQSANVLNLDSGHRKGTDTSTLEKDQRKYSNHVPSSDEDHRKRSKDKKEQNKTDVKANNRNTQNVSKHEEQPRHVKENKRHDSFKQKEALKQREMDAVRHRGFDGSSKHGRHHRHVQYDSVGQGSASTLSSGYDRRLEESTIVPGNEGRADLLNLVDYEFDSEYDDFTDDLTDTYTYTSYDDDLTEVSSLPC